MHIDFLAHHPDCVPTLAYWFHQEWSDLYSDRSLKDVENLIRGRMNKDKLPLVLVALEQGKLVGTVCLKGYDMDTRHDLTPWLAGIYVAEESQGTGIGSKLVPRIEQTAGQLHIRKLSVHTGCGRFLCKIRMECS